MRERARPIGAAGSPRRVRRLRGRLRRESGGDTPTGVWGWWRRELVEPLPRRLAVGVNYPWPRNYFGTHLVGSPDERWLEVELPADLAHFRERGIGVVRFWLLCGLDGPHAWGTQRRHPRARGRERCSVVPPTAANPRYLDVFRRILGVFAASGGVRIMPCLMSFEAFARHNRAGIVHDPVHGSAVGDAFVAQVLRPLIRVAAEHHRCVHSFDLWNEPFWNDRLSLLHPARSQSGRSIDDFLERCLAGVAAELGAINGGRPRGELRIAVATTVGHAGHPDLGRYRTGDFPQFHFYPRSHLLNARLPSYVGERAPILGELSTCRAEARAPFQPDPVLRPWPELEGRDCTSQRDSVLSRLWRVNDKGYELCLLWPDIDKANELVRPGREKYSPEVWRGVDSFLSGRRV